MDARRKLLQSGFILSGLLLSLLLATPSWAELDCGDEIGPYQVAFLTKDLVCEVGTDPALRVVGPKAVLNLGGHTVDCNLGRDIGIEVTGSGAIVLYGTVTGCKEDGVAVLGTAATSLRR